MYTSFLLFLLLLRMFEGNFSTNLTTSPQAQTTFPVFFLKGKLLLQSRDSVGCTFSEFTYIFYSGFFLSTWSFPVTLTWHLSPCLEAQCLHYLFTSYFLAELNSLYLAVIFQIHNFPPTRSWTHQRQRPNVMIFLHPTWSHVVLFAQGEPINTFEWSD